MGALPSSIKTQFTIFSSTHVRAYQKVRNISPVRFEGLIWRLIIISQSYRLRATEGVLWTCKIDLHTNYTVILKTKANTLRGRSMHAEQKRKLQSSGHDLYALGQQHIYKHIFPSKTRPTISKLVWIIRSGGCHILIYVQLKNSIYMKAEIIILVY
jgi:hypothetical protein